MTNPMGGQHGSRAGRAMSRRCRSTAGSATSTSPSPSTTPDFGSPPGEGLLASYAAYTEENLERFERAWEQVA